MRLYWRERRAGQRLMLFDDLEQETEVGAVRKTPRGFDALAKTNTYDPGRAQKDFPSLEEAKEFVENFRPWDIFGGDLDMEVESEVQPDPSGPGSAPQSPADVVSEEVTSSAAPATASVDAAPSVEAASGNEPPEEGASEETEPSDRRGWRFWKKD